MGEVTCTEIVSGGLSRFLPALNSLFNNPHGKAEEYEEKIKGGLHFVVAFMGGEETVVGAGSLAVFETLFVTVGYVNGNEICTYTREGIENGEIQIKKGIVRELVSVARKAGCEIVLVFSCYKGDDWLQTFGFLDYGGTKILRL